MLEKISTWLMAKFGLLIVGTIWATLIGYFSLFHLAAFFLDRRANRSGKDTWQYSLLIMEDHAVNVILGNWFKTTISSELGNLQRRGSTAGTDAAKVVNWGFYKVFGEIDHCINAIEPEDKHWFKPWKALLGAALFYSTSYFILTKVFA